MRVGLTLDAVAHAALCEDLDRVPKRTRSERIRYLAMVGLMVEQGRIQCSAERSNGTSALMPINGKATGKGIGSASPRLGEDLSDAGVGLD